MRGAWVVLAGLLAVGVAHAQAISPLTGAATPRRSHARTVAERFDRANTAHDGRLTLAQAWAGHMNAVARDFHAIDARQKGYVTMDDIRAYAKLQRTARHTAPVDMDE